MWFDSKRTLGEREQKVNSEFWRSLTVLNLIMLPSSSSSLLNNHCLLQTLTHPTSLMVIHLNVHSDSGREQIQIRIQMGNKKHYHQSWQSVLIINEIFKVKFSVITYYILRQHNIRMMIMVVVHHTSIHCIIDLKFKRKWCLNFPGKSNRFYTMRIILSLSLCEQIQIQTPFHRIIWNNPNLVTGKLLH